MQEKADQEEAGAKGLGMRGAWILVSPVRQDGVQPEALKQPPPITPLSSVWPKDWLPAPLEPQPSGGEQ